MSAITLPEDALAQIVSITMNDIMGNPVTVPFASFMAVWNSAIPAPTAAGPGAWQRSRGVNGQTAATLFDAAGNPVSDTLDLILAELQKLRQGMVMSDNSVCVDIGIQDVDLNRIDADA